MPADTKKRSLREQALSTHGAPDSVRDAVNGFLDRGCEFHGKLFFSGGFRIAGLFTGEIKTPDTVIVAEGGRFEGTIEAGTVIISGEVIGNILATERIEVHRPAVFRGEVSTPSLIMDEGVIFDGNTRMIGSLSRTLDANH